MEKRDLDAFQIRHGHIQVPGCSAPVYMHELDDAGQAN